MSVSDPFSLPLSLDGGCEQSRPLCLIESVCSTLSMVLFPPFPDACYGKHSPMMLTSSPCSLLASLRNSENHGIPLLCSSVVPQSPPRVLGLHLATHCHDNLTDVCCQDKSQGSVVTSQGDLISISFPSVTEKWDLCQVFPSFVVQSFGVQHKLESTFLWNKNKVGIFTVWCLTHRGIVVSWIIKNSNDQFSKYRLNARG